MQGNEGNILPTFVNGIIYSKIKKLISAKIDIHTAGCAGVMFFGESERNGEPWSESGLRIEVQRKSR